MEQIKINKSILKSIKWWRQLHIWSIDRHLKITCINHNCGRDYNYINKYQYDRSIKTNDVDFTNIFAEENTMVIKLSNTNITISTMLHLCFHLNIAFETIFNLFLFSCFLINLDIIFNKIRIIFMSLFEFMNSFSFSLLQLCIWSSFFINN